MTLPHRTDMQAAGAIVYRALAPTPQFAWPQLAAAFGAEVWVKHENHTPVGAFKVRGGLVYFDRLRQREPRLTGVIGATRGNHGQSIGFAARAAGWRATVVVPRGNSRAKNSAMRALGVDLVEHGDDFQSALDHATDLARQRTLHLVPAFDADLVAGVATYWLEFFAGAPPLDAVYVPIGLGTGIAACIAARAALGSRARIIGVVSAHAPSYLESLRTGQLCEVAATTRLADGLACRRPVAAALELIRKHADDVVAVSDDEVAGAMRLLFTTTHNVAEGAGAAATAAAWRERGRLCGQRIGLVLSGGNIDADEYARVLAASDARSGRGAAAA